jgi:hypothetical protein
MCSGGSNLHLGVEALIQNSLHAKGRTPGFLSATSIYAELKTHV